MKGQQCDTGKRSLMKTLLEYWAAAHLSAPYLRQFKKKGTGPKKLPMAYQSKLQRGKKKTLLSK
jgi:hypothetical protein